MKRKKPILRMLKCLGIFAYFLLIPSFAAQAAVFFVNSPSDVMDASPGNGICETAAGNGICTLRAAIMEANALAGADQIFLPSLPSPNTYVLTIIDELTIGGSSLTITGFGASTTIIDGNKVMRPNSGVLTINSGLTVKISGVTIRNGARNSGGGGISNFGVLTLTDSVVSANSVNSGVSFGGGGIFNPGTLILTNSFVSANNSNTFGGGIDNFGEMTLVNSTVSGNNALHGGGIVNDGKLSLVNSTVSGNNAGIDGGGINNGGIAVCLTPRLLTIGPTLISTSPGSGAGSSMTWAEFSISRTRFWPEISKANVQEQSRPRATT